MKKLNKKILFILLIVVIGTIASQPLQAYNNRVSHIHENKCDCEYIEYEYKNIPEEKVEKITNFILEIQDDSPSKSNIFCIFGHDIQTGIVNIYEHNIYPTTPKCKLSTSSVEYCARNGCDYFKVTKTYVSYVTCH